MTPQIFNTIKKVYHYTTFDKLEKILDSMSFLFSKLIGMNDFTEREKILYFEDIGKDNEQLSNIIVEKYKTVGQISLSQDSKQSKGYSINSLWGHYANSGEGCCLVFEKNRLITEADKKGYLYSSVKYNNGNSDFCIPKKVNSAEEVEKYFRKNWKALFYNKTKDWKYEQEYRILDLSFKLEPQYLSIKNSLIGVIFHSNCFDPVWDSPRINNFIKKLKSIKKVGLSYEYSNMFRGKKGYVLKDGDGNEWNEESNYSHELDI